MIYLLISLSLNLLAKTTTKLDVNFYLIVTMKTLALYKKN